MSEMPKRRMLNVTRESRVLFLGEQDGAPEREFKDAALVAMQACQEVYALYLARVSYDEIKVVHIAICIKTANADQKFITTSIARIFATLFSTHEHLDVLFLSEDQEISLSKVCHPFYQKQKTV